MIEEHGVRYVMKRADHAGNIFDWRALDAPLAHGPGIVAVKILDDEIATGVKDISQMIVAMMAGPHTGDSHVPKRVEAVA